MVTFIKWFHFSMLCFLLCGGDRISMEYTVAYSANVISNAFVLLAQCSECATHHIRGTDAMTPIQKDSNHLWPILSPEV